MQKFKKLKILQISFTNYLELERDGARNSILRFTKNLSEDADIFTASISWEKEIVNDKIINFKRSKWPRYFLPYPVSTRTTKQILNYVQNVYRDFDYIVFQGLQVAGIYFYLEKRNPKINNKSVIIFHDIESEYFYHYAKFTKSFINKCYYLINSLLYKKLEKKLSKKKIKKAFVTFDDYKSYIKSYGSNLCCFPMINLREEKTLLLEFNNNREFCYFGDCSLNVNLIPLKNIFDVFNKLNICLHIAGKKSENIHNSLFIKSYGYVDNLDLFIKNFEYAVFPIEHNGGLKNKVMDALDKGMKVITTEIGVKGVYPPRNSKIYVYKNKLELENILGLIINNKCIENYKYNFTHENYLFKPSEIILR